MKDLSLDNFTHQNLTEYLTKYLKLQEQLLDLALDEYNVKQNSNWSSETELKELENKVNKRLGRIDAYSDMLNFCKAVKMNYELNKSENE